MTTQEIEDAISRRIGDKRQYCSDLNAMHEAKKTLGVMMDNFIYELFKILNNNYEFKTRCLHWDYADEATMQLATAEQEAEAFCRAYGDWKD